MDETIKIELSQDELELIIACVRSVIRRNKSVDLTGLIEKLMEKASIN